MTESTPFAVLVIEDDPDARTNLVDILELDGYRVRSAGTFAEALAQDGWEQLLAVVVDRRLPDGTADERLSDLRRRAPQAAVIIVTGFADLDGAIAALRQGASDYILKPIDAEPLRARLARIAENRRVKDALQKSEAALHAVFEAAPCMIVILSADGKIRYFSPYAEVLTGHSAGAVIGRDFFDLFVTDPALRERLRRRLTKVFAGRPAIGSENPIRCQDGTERWMIWNSQRLDDYCGEPAILRVGQDITPLKRAQEQALQSERLAAIGQMMAGLAHESGNALQRSQACLEMLRLEVLDRAPLLDLVRRIQEAQDHLHQLYEEVRGYAAPIRLRCEPHDLLRLLETTWEHLSVPRQGRSASLQITACGGAATSTVDRFSIEQVFRNILENSLSACRDPVAITARFGTTELDGRPAVSIALADNGPGLTPEAQARIFEPFYTTKTRGTGLGMAITRRLVEAHGGRIRTGKASQGAEIVIELLREPFSESPP